MNEFIEMLMSFGMAEKVSMLVLVAIAGIMVAAGVKRGDFKATFQKIYETVKSFSNIFNLFKKKQ